MYKNPLTCISRLNFSTRLFKYCGPRRYISYRSRILPYESIENLNFKQLYKIKFHNSFDDYETFENKQNTNFGEISLTDNDVIKNKISLIDSIKTVIDNCEEQSIECFLLLIGLNSKWSFEFISHLQTYIELNNKFHNDINLAFYGFTENEIKLAEKILLLMKTLTYKQISLKMLDEEKQKMILISKQ